MRSLSPAERLSTDPAAAGSRRYRSGQSLPRAALPAGTAIGLTNNEKLSFNMYYIQDLSIKEISEVLGTKEANVKYYLYSARNKIKEKYDE